MIKLLAFVSDKDLFAEFYRKRLSRRLLVEKCSSEHQERSVLGQLKQQCGAQFTSKVSALTLYPRPEVEQQSGAQFTSKVVLARGRVREMMRCGV